MVRKLVCAMILLVFCVGVTLADEIRAIIIKVDGNKVTFAESKGKGERGEEKTLPVAWSRENSTGTPRSWKPGTRLTRA